MRFILASASPRRRELLKSINLDFEIIPSHIPEVRGEEESPEEYVARLSREKAGAIAEKFPQLVNKAWRGRFRYGEGLVAPGVKTTRKSPTTKLVKSSDSPVRAIARGVVLGLCVLGVLYVVHHVMHGGM